MDLRSVAEALEELESEKLFENSSKAQKMRAMERATKLLVKGEKVQVCAKEAEPFPSDGGVYVNGKELTITDTKSFAKVVGLADSFEITAKADGRVELCLGLTNMKTEEERQI